MGRIDLTPGFPAFLALLWHWNRAAFWPFLAAIAIHELGHAAVLLFLGGEILGVRLGFAQLELRTGFLSTRAELLGTAAGPAVNLLCCAAFSHAAPEFAAASLLLGAFNLLPFWPLDGGRLLRAALTARYGTEGGKTAQRLELLFGGLLFLAAALTFWAGGGPWPVFAAGWMLLRVIWMQRREKAVAFPAL